LGKRRRKEEEKRSINMAISNLLVNCHILYIRREEKRRKGEAKKQKTKKENTATEDPFMLSHKICHWRKEFATSKNWQEKKCHYSIQ